MRHKSLRSLGDVWGYLAQGREQELFTLIQNEDLPTTYRIWLKEATASLTLKFLLTSQRAHTVLSSCPVPFEYQLTTRRKDTSDFFHTTAPDMVQLLFGIIESNYDPKRSSRLVWRHVRPRGEKPNPSQTTRQTTKKG